MIFNVKWAPVAAQVLPVTALLSARVDDCYLKLLFLGNLPKCCVLRDWAIAPTGNTGVRFEFQPSSFYQTVNGSWVYASPCLRHLIWWLVLINIELTEGPWSAHSLMPVFPLWDMVLTFPHSGTLASTSAPGKHFAQQNCHHPSKICRCKVWDERGLTTNSPASHKCFSEKGRAWPRLAPAGNGNTAKTTCSSDLSLFGSLLDEKALIFKLCVGIVH